VTDPTTEGVGTAWLRPRGPIFPQCSQLLLAGPGEPLQKLIAPGDAVGVNAIFRSARPVRRWADVVRVDDLTQARRELESAGVDLIGPTERDDQWEWLDVRASDGHLYELGARRR
jgi:hypothetical protein